MRKSVIFIFALVAIISIPVIAGATPITYIDTTYFTETGTIAAEDYIDHGQGAVNKLDETMDYVTWAHQFVLIPPAATILSATLSLDLYDDDDDVWDDPLTWDIGIGYAEDGTWDLDDVDTGDYVYSANVDYLADGRFEVTLGSIWGDFYIHHSDLEISYEPVPEPGTIMLLGIGLAGLFGVRKKFKI